MGIGASSGSSLYNALGPRQTRVAVTSLRADGELYIYLIEIHLDAAKEKLQAYSAVSYTWGYPVEMRPLKITGARGAEGIINVTSSAIAAMKDILQKFPVGTRVGLWIDQISIDQSSESEKIEQIMMMKDIYAKAKEVVAWLGYASEDSDLAMDKINQLDVSMGSRRWVALNGATVELSEFEAHLGSADDTDNMNGWRAILNLFGRQYFRRAWILQEITAGNYQQNIVVCGQKYAPLGAFNQIYRFWAGMSSEDVPNKLPNFLFLGGKESLLNTVFGFSFMREQTKGQPLVHLARRIRGCEITDQRDRLACMLSFATDINDPRTPFELDYSLAAGDTFTQFTVWSIYKYSNLDILSDCTGGHAQGTTLPSWIADWSIGDNSAPFKVKSIAADNLSISLFSASGKYNSDLSIRLPLPESPGALKVAGIRLSALHQSIDFFNLRDGRLYERDWDFSPFHCPLNDCNMADVFKRTRTHDVAGLLIENTVVHERRGASPCAGAEASFDETLMADTCNGRVLFLVKLKNNTTSFLMGIGPEGLTPGDEVWMLKGGKVLYILRPLPIPGKASGNVFDVTGGPHEERTFHRDEMVYGLIGEAFMLGLMDGEIVDMMGENPRRRRPPQLDDMDKEFRSIYLV